MTSAEKIRLFRSLTVYSQSDIAKKLGISQPYYAQLESTKNLQAAHATSLAALLHLNQAWLLESGHVSLVPFTKKGGIYYVTVPAPDLRFMTKRVQNRVTTDAVSSIHELLPLFLNVSGVGKCYVLRIDDIEHLYMFELRHDQRLIIRVLSQRFVEIMDVVINGLRAGSVTKVDFEQSRSFDPDEESKALQALLAAGGKYAEQELPGVIATLISNFAGFGNKSAGEAEQVAIMRICDDIERCGISWQKIHDELCKRAKKLSADVI